MKIVATPVIWIRVKDDPDGDIVPRLFDELSRMRLKPVAWRAEPGGFLPKTGDVYMGGFAPDDAERVLAWLREQQAKVGKPTSRRGPRRARRS